MLQRFFIKSNSPVFMALLHQVKPVRLQKEITYNILRERLDKILPLAMDASELDMWLIICQEDNLDPVFSTMIPMDSWPRCYRYLSSTEMGIV